MECNGIVANTIASRFKALQSRDFRLVFFTGSISNIGNWMEIVLRNWLVYEISGSAFILGLSNVVHWLPFLVLSPITGVYVDRWDKRWVIFYAQLALTLVTIMLGVLSLAGVIAIWHVMVLVLIHGIAETFDSPARQTLVSELVDKDTVLNAVSLNSGVFHGTRFIGPAIGGLLITTSGVGLGFVINGLTFIPYMIALLFLRTSFNKSMAKRANTWSDLLEGLRYLKQEKTALAVLVTIGLVSVFSFSYQTLLPVFAADILKVGPDGLGFLNGAVGFGAVLSAVSLAFWSSRLKRAGLFICLMAGIYGISLLVFSASLSYELSMFCLLVAGASNVAFNSSCNALLQTQSPPNLRGRVMGVYTMTSLGTNVFGSFIIGALGQAMGAQAGLGLSAAVTVALAIAAFMVSASLRNLE
ncbi:MAG: MFS transporter [Thermincola sp.]|nr:MFS transporter [Thermincola sp.]MDT3701431.1 MFS transporter [Thermincola sp.]